MPKTPATQDQLAAEQPKVGYTADALDEVAIARWKTAHIADARAGAELEAARADVDVIFSDHGADFITSSLGSLARGGRDAGVKIDWKAIALEGIAEKKLEKLKDKHSTPTDAKSWPVAPMAWGLEAKSS